MSRLAVRLMLLTAIALALRIEYCACSSGLGRTPTDGYREYVVTAQRLLAQHAMISPLMHDAHAANGASCLLPPAYVVLAGAAYGLLGIETYWATLVLQLINAAASSIVVVFVFLIARRLGGEFAAWWASILAAVNPVLIGFTDFIWDTCLFTFGVAICVWLALWLERASSRSWTWMGFGMALGALALLNPALTTAYPILVLWPLYRRSGWSVRHMIRPVLAALAGWIVTIAPWTVRNYFLFDQLIYVRGNLLSEVWLGVCPEADTAPSDVFTRRYPMLNAQEQHVVTQVGEQQYVKDCGRRALEAIRRNPGRYLTTSVLRAVDFWTGAVFTHASAGENWWPRTWSRAAVLIQLSAETAVIIAGMLLLRRGDGAGWLLAIVVSFSGIYCLTHMAVRFRAPVEPIVAVLIGLLAARAAALRRRAT